MGANEQLGRAVRLYVDTTPLAAPTYTVLECETDSGMTWATERFDTTGKCDAGVATHKVVGISQTVTFTVNVAAADPGTQRLMDNYLAQAFTKFQWKALNGNMYVGEGSVDLSFSGTDKGVIVVTGTLEVSGGLTQSVAA